MNVVDRPTEMLLRQLDALRKAIHYRNPETGRRHYCHVQHFRKPFADGVREFRAELMRRGVLRGPRTHHGD